MYLTFYTLSVLHTFWQFFEHDISVEIQNSFKINSILLKMKKSKQNYAYDARFWLIQNRTNFSHLKNTWFSRLNHLSIDSCTLKYLKFSYFVPFKTFVLTTKIKYTSNMRYKLRHQRNKLLKDNSYQENPQ